MGLFVQLSTEYNLDARESQTVAGLADRAATLLDREPVRVAELLLQLPSGLRAAVLRFADEADSGHFLIRGLRIGELPDTPQDHGPTRLLEHTSTGTLLLVAELLGSLIGYADEKSGDLVHEVHPVRGEEDRIENTGSVAFDFHTENVHHPLRPDFLGLLCLRQDHDGVAATRVASVRQAVAYLTEEQQAELRHPQFHSLYPTSFTRSTVGERPTAGLHPVLFGSPGRLFMRFNSHNTRAEAPAARSALRALAEALEAVSVDLVLQPGELVLVNNHVAAHGRSGFRARYDGADRWLRRCYSLSAIPRWAEDMMPAPRVLPSMADIRGVL